MNCVIKINRERRNKVMYKIMNSRDIFAKMPIPASISNAHLPFHLSHSLIHLHLKFKGKRGRKQEDARGDHYHHHRPLFTLTLSSSDSNSPLPLHVDL